MSMNDNRARLGARMTNWQSEQSHRSSYYWLKILIQYTFSFSFLVRSKSGDIICSTMIALVFPGFDSCTPLMIHSPLCSHWILHRQSIGSSSMLQGLAKNWVPITCSGCGLLLGFFRFMKGVDGVGMNMKKFCFFFFFRSFFFTTFLWVQVCVTLVLV